VFGASVQIIHVLENPFTHVAFSELYGPPGDFFERLESRTRNALEGLLTSDQKTRYSAVFVLRDGAPARQILDYINEHGAIDLVVMATVGRGGVARLMLGSVADKIVRAAPCPVLTMHHRSDVAESPPPA
jgi:nucleotide-binding universal stress UspA family protein